jgi:carbon storage regulator
MLILSRRPDESLKLGDDVTTTILGARGSTVGISVDAPKSLPVHRKRDLRADPGGARSQATVGARGI